MATVLCFGDSNTWGSDPDSDERLAPDVRWPGIVRAELGGETWVVEEGLPGRTAVVEDPVWPHLTALPYLLPALESHAPLDAVVLMLGTNDVQERYGRSSAAIGGDILGLAEIAARTPCGPDGRAPYILVVAPPAIGSVPDPLWAAEYKTGAEKARDLPALLEAGVASASFMCGFLDAGEVAAFGADGIHLDAAGHRAVGKAIAGALGAALAKRG